MRIRDHVLVAKALFTCTCIFYLFRPAERPTDWTIPTNYGTSEGVVVWYHLKLLLFSRPLEKWGRYGMVPPNASCNKHA